MKRKTVSLIVLLVLLVGVAFAVNYFWEKSRQLDLFVRWFPKIAESTTAVITFASPMLMDNGELVRFFVVDQFPDKIVRVSTSELRQIRHLEPLSTAEIGDVISLSYPAKEKGQKVIKPTEFAVGETLPPPLPRDGVTTSTIESVYMVTEKGDSFLYIFTKEHGFFKVKISTHPRVLKAKPGEILYFRKIKGLPHYHLVDFSIGLPLGSG